MAAKPDRFDAIPGTDVNAVSPTAADGLRCVHYLDAVRLERGGVVRAVLNLVRGLASAGARVTLLTGDAEDVPDEWRGAGGPGLPSVVEVPRVVTPLLRLTAGDRELVHRVLSQADVLHLHTPWEPLNLPIAAEAYRRGVPYFIGAHGMLSDWAMGIRPLKKRVYLRLLAGRMLRRAHALLLNSESESDEAARWAPGVNRRVLPLVLDLPNAAGGLPKQLAQEAAADDPARAAREAYPVLSTQEEKLLLLSRVFPGKGVERLIDATATLAARGSSPVTLVAGPGDEAYLDQLKQRAEERGVARQVHFLGPVYGDLKASLFAACDAFVLPSDHENFGLALVEAMLADLPTVATDGVHVWRELERCGAKIVSKRASAGEPQLADSIEAALATQERGSGQPGRSTRERLLEWLDPSRVVRSYLDLYASAGVR